MTTLDLSHPRLLQGEWDFHRRIDDQLTGDTHTVTGQARITNRGDGALSWDETGSMRLAAAGEVISVTRSLLLVEAPEATKRTWEVRFADGRPFHPWRVGEDVIHLCGADTYRGNITAMGDDWLVTWEVTGPEKRYCSHTRYHRPGM